MGKKRIPQVDRFMHKRKKLHQKKQDPSSDSVNNDADPAADATGSPTASDLQEPSRPQRHPKIQVVKENESFERFYKAQDIMDKSEWDRFMQTLREPLPSTFRIVTSSRYYDQVKDRLQQYKVLYESASEELARDVLQHLPWYPENLGWKCTASRDQLRKESQLQDFYTYLKVQNDLGSINRQEAVSMIPPLLLAIEPWMNVIDLCAAPGSKTAQILDMMATPLRLDENSAHLIRGPSLNRPKGIVIANDSDLKRCWMLEHQMKRFHATNLLVTNHDATRFPAYIQFDRVLCDVPCSGDGTIRKNPLIWRDWTAVNGRSLHKLQLEIAKNGINILKPGGIMIYSTCSLNPLENEAVVCGLISHYGDDVIEILDMSDHLPGLKRRPGLTTWKVNDNSGKKDWLEPFDQLLPRQKKKIKATLYPPEPNSKVSQQLGRCMRLLPHDQDTGGFFIAVLRKKKETSPDDEAVQMEDLGAAGKQGNDMRAGLPDADEAAENGICPAVAVVKDKVPQLCSRSSLIAKDPMKSIREYDPMVIESIAMCYGIDGEFLEKNFMARTEKSESDNIPRKIYNVSEAAGQLACKAIGNENVDENLEPLRLVQAGVLTFTYDPQYKDQLFRLKSNGLTEIIGQMRKRKYAVSKETFATMLQLNKFSIEKFEELVPEATGITPGSLVVHVEGCELDAMILWKLGGVTVSMPKDDLLLLNSKFQPDALEKTKEVDIVEADKD